MLFSLDFKEKRTTAKLTAKEQNNLYCLSVLKAKGFNMVPYKISSRFVYYEAKGDKMNPNNPQF